MRDRAATLMYSGLPKGASNFIVLIDRLRYCLFYLVPDLETQHRKDF